MNYRTDLAVELDEMLTAARRGSGTPEAGAPVHNITGYLKKQSQIDEDISVIDIEITDEEGERAFGKPRGRYVTLEVQGVIEQRNGIKERAAAALADELAKFVKHDYYLKALVVGLGNEKVTPDSLGPHTADKVKITSHLFEIFECDGDWDYSNVCGFNPSVTGITGLETAELIDKVVSLARPDVVLAIDALAAQHDDSDLRHGHHARSGHGKPSQRNQQEDCGLSGDQHRRSNRNRRAHAYHGCSRRNQGSRRRRRRQGCRLHAGETAKLPGGRQL